MISDASKNITVITYNHLNLPRTFTFSTGNTIEMTYDASGMKLSKVVKQGATVASRMDYVKGIEYHNSKLQAIYHSEGRVAYCDATQTQSITAPINGETKNFKAGLITATNTITGNANVTMQAATSMTYLPGFQVEQGSTFLGNILPPPCVAATAYEYVIRDHLGNGRIYFVDYNGNGIVEEANGEILQEAHYDPWGYALGGSWVNNSSVDNLYQYNGKEVNNDIGLGLMDYGARWYDPGVGKWTSVDPMASQFPSYSPFNFSLNNPIRLIDPDGRAPYDVIIKGAEKQAAFNELQASVKGQLTLSMDVNGKVSSTQDGTGKLSKDAQQLTNAINDNSVVVNVNAENTTTTQSGNLYIGGAFSGNTVTKGANGNTVVAEQEVNPGVLNKVSTAHGKPGADILHEVTEAYQGGLISQKNGVSSPASNLPGSVYQKSHNRATNQSGQISERIYDASGNEMQMPASGGYPAGVKSADWYVNDKKGNKVIIQTIK